MIVLLEGIITSRTPKRDNLKSTITGLPTNTYRSSLPVDYVRSVLAASSSSPEAFHYISNVTRIPSLLVLGVSTILLYYISSLFLLYFTNRRIMNII